MLKSAQEEEWEWEIQASLLLCQVVYYGLPWSTVPGTGNFPHFPYVESQDTKDGWTALVLGEGALRIGSVERLRYAPTQEVQPFWTQQRGTDLSDCGVRCFSLGPDENAVNPSTSPCALRCLFAEMFFPGEQAGKELFTACREGGRPLFRVQKLQRSLENKGLIKVWHWMGRLPCPRKYLLCSFQ